MNNVMLAQLMAMGIDVPFEYRRFPELGLRRPRREKARTVCLLPGCEETTTHNGGYCSPAHCAEHRTQRKGE